ncbi:MAG: KpsF/GutQ family sugar-phosphate isomerase [Candidatus Latescibacterota bacterium]|nr:MAG: KpsF/GutQ family sugar-phosphate isomerase [Candidatus Latescibacterota bacterium]
MIGPSFARAVAMIHRAIVRPEDPAGTRLGKIVVTGVGKSGLVARKIAATFNSTGATAFYLHPVEAVHGDLGMIHRDDVAILVSRSGANEELKRLLPSLRLLGIGIIAITAKADSDLASAADEVLLIGDGPEACSLGLAPTASAVASLAMGDALALTLFDLRGLKSEDFARFHPSGVLGRRLLLRVSDVMHRGEEVPLVGEGADMKEALLEIVGKRLGATGVVDAAGRLVGILTDGDLKRILLRRPDVLSLRVGETMTRAPRTISPDALVAEALSVMHGRPDAVITCLFVVDDSSKPLGFLHMYDCLRAGIDR